MHIFVGPGKKCIIFRNFKFLKHPFQNINKLSYFTNLFFELMKLYFVKTKKNELSKHLNEITAETLIPHHQYTIHYIYILLYFKE